MKNISIPVGISDFDDENLIYDYLHSSEDNFWSMLYLTKLRDYEYDRELPEGSMALIIPNAEIKEILGVSAING